MAEPLRDTLATLAAGGMVVLADSSAREDEGDLVMSAAHVTAADMAFLLRHGSGIVCTPMSERRADELDLPLMVERNTERHGTAFTVSVDHVDTGTGISAADRTLTARALAAPATRPGDLARPGHLFPLRARPGGVLERAGHTEAAVDVLALAGAGDVAVITELVGDDGVPLGGEGPRAFAREHGLPYLHIDELRRARSLTAATVVAAGSARLPVDAASGFRATCFRSAADGVEHVALTLGDVAAAGSGPDGVLVRLHSECLTGDVFGSRRCDCGEQLRASLRLIADAGAGVVVYLRGHEGRGIGLARKLQAYALQERGLDTVDANTALGLPADGRDYRVGASILAALGARRVRLVTHNPEKAAALARHGVEVLARVGTGVRPGADNVAYLRTKRDRMGHDLDLDVPGADPLRARSA